MNLLKRLWPQRIGMQIALVVMASLVIAHVLFTSALLAFSQRPNPLSAPGTDLVRLALIAPMLDAAQNTEERTAILKVARDQLPALEQVANLPWGAAPMKSDPIANDLRARLGDRFAFFMVPPSGDERPRVAVRLPDGSALLAPIFPPRGFGPSFGLILSLVLFASVVTLLSVWAAVTVTAPLARFADAADNFTLGRAESALPERGPREIVRMARALNGMWSRVQRMVEDRGHMLAAIGHDLRTPITRLRLRAEEIDQPELRKQVVRDLEGMENMVHSALSFLRDQHRGASFESIDLPALVQTICDDFADAGREISCDGPAHLYVSGNADQLTRAITNLVDNGLKFADHVVVKVGAEADVSYVDVEDRGPGIPDADKARVFEPFHRGDQARNADGKDGFGLGLSISRAIAEAHRGSLSLHDANPMGLRARLALPREQRTSS